jgi:hypothetical protein
MHLNILIALLQCILHHTSSCQIIDHQFSNTNQTLKNKEEEMADFKNGIKVILTILTDRSTKTLCRSAACRAVTSSREQIVAAAAITEG